MDGVELARAYTKQLEMVRLPGAAPLQRPHVPSGYVLRQYREADRDSYLDMFQQVFDEPCALGFWARYVLDEGFFVVEEESSGRIVASCMATWDPGDGRSLEGHLNWLAALSEHRGLGLGLAAAAAVTDRLESEGCPRMWLMTDDHRLSAIGIYLRLGWRPHIFSDHMALRWGSVLRRLRGPGACAGKMKGERVRHRT
ncbi:MAG: GNAT family N-acetyltransferase [Chloroflexota bacterium]